jgi:hypothetical protein
MFRFAQHDIAIYETRSKGNRFVSLFHQFVYIRVNSWLSLCKLQASGLPAVAEPFHQNNLPFVIEKSFLIVRLLL